MNKIKNHFDLVAKNYDFYKKKNWYYYKNLKILLHTLIPAKKEVFEVGCGTGDLLAELHPVKGFGMDLSSKMIQIAKTKHKKNKNLTFSTSFPKRKYDYVFMSDVIEHLEDARKTLQKIHKTMSDKSLFINTMANPIWEPVLLIAEKLGMKMPEGPHKRISFGEFEGLLTKCGFEVVSHDFKLLFPVYVPFLSNFINTFFEKKLKRYAFIEYIVARKV
jgi:ubiquinone/menaquinone biosynthesis C-methylase UbiE